jgi:hypothetical protein
MDTHKKIIQLPSILKYNLEDLTSWEYDYKVKGYLIGIKDSKQKNKFLVAHITGVGQSEQEYVNEKSEDLDNISNLLSKNKNLIYKEFQTAPIIFSQQQKNINGFSELQKQKYKTDTGIMRNQNCNNLNTFSYILIQRDNNNIITWHELNSEETIIIPKIFEMSQPDKSKQDLIVKNLINYSKQNYQKSENLIIYK